MIVEFFILKLILTILHQAMLALFPETEYISLLFSCYHIFSHTEPRDPFG